jgi:hypothetical protein
MNESNEAEMALIYTFIPVSFIDAVSFMPVIYIPVARKRFPS